MQSFAKFWGLASGVVLAFGDVGLAAERGIAVKPNDAGRFVYADDFQTARFLDDAFLSNLKVDSWRKGSITNSGPNRNRVLTYRFFGDRVIAKLEIRVEQSANGPNLGGSNSLYLSGNGLDWTRVASSGDHKADRNGWQREPLTASAEQVESFVGRSEVWVRVVLDNYCGLKTGTSNTVSSIEVKLQMAGSAGAKADPQAELRAAWGALVRKAGWRRIALDWADPADARAPHYYEDSDGWLREPGSRGHLVLNEGEGFGIRRAYLNEGRSPLSLVAFVQADEGQLTARIVVRSRRDSSRRMQVFWDGKIAATFDVANYFERDRVFYVKRIEAEGRMIHKLRVAGGDSGSVLVRQIALVGEGEVSWVEKPALPAGGRVEVLSAYYMPDALPPAGSQVVEGRVGQKQPGIGLVFRGLQRVYKEHAEFGALRVVVRNSEQVTVRIGDGLLLNGKPIEESYVDFTKSEWDARGVVWFRVRPRLLGPGQCGEIYIRFRRRPAGDHAAIRIPVDGQPMNVNISYGRAVAGIDYVTTDASMQKLYVYARRPKGVDSGNVIGMTLDGKPVENAHVYGGDFPGGVALCVAALPARLREGTYHIAGVITDREERPAAQFRVLGFTFPRSSIHVPPASCKAMHMNLAMWHEQSLETCEKYDLDTTTTSLFDLHKRVKFILGPDEPDAHDNRGGGYNKGLGWHARRLAESGWQELVERFSPGAASWIIMNGTTRPVNWWVYGQFADISCFDPYPVTFYGADHAYVRESLLTARASGTPKRMYACLEAYGWGKGQGVPKGARGPTPAEYRQNVVQAIGVGTKGLTSWVHSRGAGGWELNEPVAKEIANCNALIEGIVEELLLGTPVDLAGNDAGDVLTGTVAEAKWPKPRVWTGALLCGPDAIVVAAVNHIPAGKPEPPTIEPARDVTITVRLPDFLREVEAFEATENGVVAFPCKVEGAKAVLKVDAIASGRVFVLRRKG